MARLTIRARLILLSSLLLLVLVATNLYLTRRLAENSAGLVEAAKLLDVIGEANDAQYQFGELRYWLTALSVSQMAEAGQHAATAREALERSLDRLTRPQPQAVAAIRDELAQYEDLAGQAVEEYTADQRDMGNKLLAEASRHSVAVDTRLDAIVKKLTEDSQAARTRLVARAAAAARLSRIVVAAAVLFGALLTFLVLRSIARPLRRLVIAMNGLNAGNLAVAIPPAGPDEIGAMARTLAAFRATLEELRHSIAQFEALSAVGRAVGAALDLGTVQSLVVARAVELSRAGAGMIWEYDEATREFRFGISHGVEPALTESLKAHPIGREQGVIGRAIETGAPVQVPDFAASRLMLPELADRLAGLGYRSLLAAPLLHEDEILGGLVILRRTAGDFSKETVGLVEAFATQSALAVRNAKLFDEQRRREQELRAANDRLRAAQASLVQAEKMASLGQLTAGIAHEIKNPLNFINNFAELSSELLDELKAAIGSLGKTQPAAARAETDEVIATLTGNLEKIVEHGRRADGIVKSMLLHSRGGVGERQTTDLNALADEALGLAYHGARARDPGFNIALERDFDPALAPIDVVPQDVTRVFLNLFGNGFYATDKRRRESGDRSFQPALKVTTRDLGDEVEIKIRDNGTGIPPEVRAKLFTPFFTTKPTGEGTGLGLSISYDIVVQEHGGTITVDSREGEFTEFVVRLPRHPQRAPATVASGVPA
jgi:signal transduction histidine kinase/HAMP domain-containing protein